MVQVVVTGEKFDVADQIELLLKDRIDKLKVEDGKRHRFVKDDDGHTYLIPADKKLQFECWVDSTYESSIPHEGEDFSEYRNRRQRLSLHVHRSNEVLM